MITSLTAIRDLRLQGIRPDEYIAVSTIGRIREAPLHYVLDAPGNDYRPLAGIPVVVLTAEQRYPRALDLCDELIRAGVKDLDIADVVTGVYMAVRFAGRPYVTEVPPCV